MVCLLACIVGLLTSCASDVNDDPVSSEGEKMSFDVAGLSRASVATGIDKFVVFGDKKFAPGSKTASPSVLFDKTEVTCSGGVWTYEGSQYWLPKHEHSFVALSPVSVLGPGADHAYSASKLSFTYAIPLAGGVLKRNDDVSDILLATHRRYYDPDRSPDSKITFTFGHILSLINFAPAFSDNLLSGDSYISIHKLEFSGISLKARIGLLPAERLSNPQTDDKIVEVSSRQTGNLVIELPAPVKIGNNAANVSLFADNDALIMLPQSFNADSSLTFYFTINGDAAMRQVDFPLDNFKWDSGSRYNYKFTIDRTGVKFGNCEINDWNEVKGEEVSVD